MNTVIQSLLRQSRSYRDRRFRSAVQQIAAYRFPHSVLFHARENMPAGMLDSAICGLKNFFLAHAQLTFSARRASRHELAVPSAGVDALWHAFILDTRAYAAFCKSVFDAPLHHYPAAQNVSAIDSRERTLYAIAHTYEVSQEARWSAWAASPLSRRAFGEQATLFTESAFETHSFPHVFTLEEIAAASQLTQRGKALALQSVSEAKRRDSATSGGDSAGGASYASADCPSGSSGASSCGDGGGGSGCGGGGCGGGS
jgi:hypothetical protein